MDFKKIASELQIAVRSDISRSTLARRLATRLENISRWENGSRRISWSDFADICEVTGKNLGASLTANFSYNDDPRDGCSLARKLLGAAKLTQVAKDTEISRFSLMRWQQNKTEPSLPEILQIMHHCQYMMLEFIAHLVDISTVPEAWDAYEKRRKRKEIYYQIPAVAAILCCLKLDEYKQLPGHQSGYIAKKIGISQEEEEVAIDRLLIVGKIVRKGSHYEPIDEQLELTDSESFRSFSTYWLNRAADFCQNTENPIPIIGYGMEICPTSKDTLKALRDEYCSFYLRVRALLAQDSGPRDSVYVFQSLFFDLDKRFDDKKHTTRKPKPQQTRNHHPEP